MPLQSTTQVVDILLNSNPPPRSPALLDYISLNSSLGEPKVGFNGFDLGQGTGDGRNEVVGFSFNFKPFQSIQSASLTLDLTLSDGSTDELLFADNSSIRGAFVSGAKFYGNKLLSPIHGSHQSITFDLTHMDTVVNGNTSVAGPPENLSPYLLDGTFDVAYADDAIIHSARLQIVGTPNKAPGHIYFLTNPAKGSSWTDAEAQAVAAGGHLVTINDAAEQMWLNHTFDARVHYGDSILKESFWIGLYDPQGDNTDQWISGEPVTYTNWASGEPNSAYEQYGELNPSFAADQWNDRDVYASEIGGRGIAEVVGSMTGSPGDDFLYALGGDVTIAGGAGNDKIFGDVGDDILRGDANNISAQGKVGGNDTIDGGGGDDRIGGKGGDDTLFGNEGNDQIWGDSGNDLLNGGPGCDTLRGGTGRDTFVLMAGGGVAKIKDFALGQDYIALFDKLSLGDITQTQHGRDVWINLNNQTHDLLAIVSGVKVDQLTASSFRAGFTY
ncbi:MAG TPA: lectin-like protein [Chroococcidiopsis sp.]